MADGIDINIFTGKAKEIANRVDNNNVKDGRIADKEISIFLNECERSGIDVEEESWYSKCADVFEKHMQSLQDKISKFVPPKQQHVEVPDAMYVEPTPEVKAMKVEDAKRAKIKNIKPAPTKEEICKGMYEKWKSKFKSSPLGLSFYEKLYDVIKTLNISSSSELRNLRTKNEKQKEEKIANKYQSVEERTMDEVIAVLAGESRLNPRSKGRFNGLFQLDQKSLNDLKRWAKNHPEIPEAKKIQSNMTIAKFRTLSGAKQLDYLIAFIIKSKNASDIEQDEKITPEQLWAMIKLPSKGQNENLIRAKRDSIQRVLQTNKIPYGIA